MLLCKVTYSSPMEQTMTTSDLICEACNLHLHQKVYKQHVNGKKHKIKQELYNKNHKTIFIIGTDKLNHNDLEKIFKKYGEISKVKKYEKKPFAFIQFVNKDSVESALMDQVYAGGKKLCVRRYNDNRNKPDNQEEIKEKSRKLSETLSNTSQVEGDAEKGPCMGVKELPIQIPDPDLCSEEDVILWQARDIVSQVELSAEMYQTLNEVKTDVENLFQPVMPGCQVLVFGSCGSTLAFKNSDVDLYLQTANSEQLKDFVRKEAREMYKSRQFKIIARIPNARVPIIKFEHIRTGWQGDLTASSQLGVRNSQLIRFLVSLDPRIKPLIMIIKYWGKVCGVTGSHTRFTTYSLVMLVIFYLQQLNPPMLPTIAHLQKMSEHKQFSLDWECSFCDEEWRVQSECLSQPNNLSLRELLTGFFSLYYNFDFDNVICPLLGRCISAVHFESDNGSNLPEEMFLYSENLKRDQKSKFRTNVNFKVQDPFELCLNITRNVTEKTCSVFKEACKVSLELCEKEEDVTLLKSLFSIEGESIDLAEDCVKININFKEELSDSSQKSGSSFTPWYQLTTDSIILVFKEIFKFKVEPHVDEVLNKVKKLESSQDVHTPVNNHNGNKLVFVCTGNSNVWNSRKKMSRFLNSINIALDPFEKEVCISNALYNPSDQNLFYFTLTLTSLEDLKKGGKGIEVQLKMKKLRHPLIKGFIQSMKTDFRCFVLKAQSFIDRVKRSSPVTEVKDSLKELFELQLKKLPDLGGLKKKRDELMSGKEKNDNLIENQKVFSGGSNSDGRIDDKFKTTSNFNRTDDTTTPLQNPLETKILGLKCEKNIQNVSNLISENNGEKDVNKCVLLSENILSAEPQTLIDEFFKPTSPNQITDFKESSRSSESTEVDKFNNLLNSIQNMETQSTFTSDKVNPFLASIEKVALKQPYIDSKTDEGNETEVNSEENKAQNLENEDKLEIINEEIEVQNIETPQEKEDKSKDSKTLGENTNHFEKSELNVETESDKYMKEGENLLSSQEKIGVNKIENQGLSNKFVNNHKIETNMCLRPMIHSERPLKQKKHNTNRHTRDAVRQPNQSKNGSPWQPWAGGGPPGCQPWRSQRQPHPPVAQNSQCHQDYRGSGRHSPLSKNIQEQKKWYPGLFKDEKTDL